MFAHQIEIPKPSPKLLHETIDLLALRFNQAFRSQCSNKNGFPFDADCWSKIKTYLRQAKARTQEALEQALKEVLLLITKEDAEGWFTSCGYPLH